MKIKITKPDGTVVECEGTAEECAKLAGMSLAPTFVPYFSPVTYPTTPWITWTTAGAVTLTEADMARDVAAGLVTYTGATS
jgi:hypothetical protein